MSTPRMALEIRLPSIESLFAEPAMDPFDPESRYVSGIDEIANQLRQQRQPHLARLAIRLPATAVNPETATTLKAAIDRFCAAQIALNEQAIAEFRINGRRAMVSAVVIAAVLLGLVLLLDRVFPFPDVLSGMIAGWVGIAIWVIFWNPIDTYVYAWRPNLRDIQVFEAIRVTELSIEKEE